jgi:hypothetical protein
MFEIVVLIALIDAIRAARHHRRISKKAAMNQVETPPPKPHDAGGLTDGEGI